MKKAIEWACFRLVMIWPGAWSSTPLANWILARAGQFAHCTDATTGEKL